MSVPIYFMYLFTYLLTYLLTSITENSKCTERWMDVDASALVSRGASFKWLLTPKKSICVQQTNKRSRYLGLTKDPTWKEVLWIYCPRPVGQNSSKRPQGLLDSLTEGQSESSSTSHRSLLPRGLWLEQRATYRKQLDDVVVKPLASRSNGTSSVWFSSLIFRLTDWLTDWLTGWLTGWLIG